MALILALLALAAIGGWYGFARSKYSGVSPVAAQSNLAPANLAPPPASPPVPPAGAQGTPVTSQPNSLSPTSGGNSVSLPPAAPAVQSSAKTAPVAKLRESLPPKPTADPTKTSTSSAPSSTPGTATTTAATTTPTRWPCEQIGTACEKAGFVRGKCPPGQWLFGRLHCSHHERHSAAQKCQHPLAASRSPDRRRLPRKESELRLSQGKWQRDERPLRRISLAAPAVTALYPCDKPSIRTSPANPKPRACLPCYALSVPRGPRAPAILRRRHRQ